MDKDKAAKVVIRVVEDLLDIVDRWVTVQERDSKTRQRAQEYFEEMNPINKKVK